MKFFIVDVFGKERYTGNQLAVFTGCSTRSSEEMQRIAREINFSETTFIMSGKEMNEGFDVRIFTPKAEVNFAGHPTLGTAYIIRNEILKEKVNTIKLNFKIGQIRVDFERDELFMTQIQPEFWQCFDRKLLSKVLSIEEDQIDSSYPIEEVSTGLPFTIVPVKSLKVLKKIRVDAGYYNEFCSVARAKGILVFSPEAYEADQTFSSRVFVDYLGVPEDPATGSGQGGFAGYLIKHKYLKKDKIDIKVGQGYEMGRPSVLALKAMETNGRIEIRVGGKVFPVADGTWC